MIATGLYQSPNIPEFSAAIPPGILQIHSMDYRNVNAPTEVVPQLRDAYEQEQITMLDLATAGIKTLIWVTGYNFDFSAVKLPVVDGDGYPVRSAV